jgi:hypothetical protein
MFVSERPAQHLRKLRPMRPNPLIATLIVTSYRPLYKFNFLPKNRHQFIVYSSKILNLSKTKKVGAIHELPLPFWFSEEIRLAYFFYFLLTKP